MTPFTLLRFALRHRLTGTPSYVILHVTNRCNLRCRTCFVPPGVEEPDLGFYRALARGMPRLWWLDIGGGEPFLRPDLAEICSLFRTEMLAIPTNGWDRETIVGAVRRIVARRSGRVVVSVSLDGPEPLHDAIRGEGSWQRAWETFRALRSLRNVATKVNTVVSRENLDELPEFCAWIRTQQADAHSLILVRGSPRDPSIMPPTPSDLRRVVPLLLAQMRGHGYAQGPLGARMLWEYHRFLWETSIAVMEQERQVVPCLAGRNHVVIWPDGKAGPCELLPPTGSLQDSSLQGLMAAASWKAQCASIAAGRCWCTHNCALLSSIPFHGASVRKLISRVMGLP